MSDDKSIWPWKDWNPRSAAKAAKDQRTEPVAPDLHDDNPWFAPRSGAPAGDAAGDPDRKSRRPGSARWLGADASPYGFSDEDGSLQQVEGANLRRSFGTARSRRFVARTGRIPSVNRAVKRDPAGGGTWLLQTVCAMGLVAAGLYAHDSQGSIADEIQRVYHSMFTEDYSTLSMPAVKQFLDDHGVSIPAFWTGSTSGVVRLHAPLAGVIQADYAPGHPEVWIAGTADAPVLAAGSGTVSQVQQDADGWSVVIEHGAVGTSLYHGLGTVSVQAGQAVSSGQVIGRLPHSDAPVLRFAMQRDGAYINPHDDIHFPEAGA
ncbi:murein hydrolase activator EnvC family protein [Alicyclobacillus macrosporangiidus]|uniref:Peptidase family M23 n=1 Tax=Alicyclobacillus macrosporangiidus TaxID=392015 RepID=A0A1I7JWC3_9BACL|nr:M23 family metallopeptidase [Alicyclobacillus macrosporangiidus]SFU89474.1 Peptidase family M23 [Alicyclobacillus macrosporangiidus]